MANSYQDRFNNPDHGIPVTKSAESLSSVPVVLHTVSSGYSLYIKSAYLGSGSDAIKLYVTDSADVQQYVLLAGSGGMVADLKGHPPLEAGYKIKAVASSSSAWNVAGFVGAEE